MLLLKRFQRIVQGHFHTHGRTLPWRFEEDPYKVFISEVMLQQTQVSRVMEKYGAFIKKFPNFRTLAKAPVSAVLRVWQGLGYNRRAFFLKRAAEEIVRNHDGALPREREALARLPGIGPATAASIRAFAFNETEIFIETNIRSVYLHFFFPRAKNVPDKKLLPLIEKTLVRRNPREWYYALMDYGAMLKKRGPNPSRRSAHHKKQTRFKGSLREARGAVLRLVLNENSYSISEIKKELPSFESKKIVRATRGLVKEGFLTVYKSKIQITPNVKSSPKSK